MHDLADYRDTAHKLDRNTGCPLRWSGALCRFSIPYRPSRSRQSVCSGPGRFRLRCIEIPLTEQLLCLETLASHLRLNFPCPLISSDIDILKERYIVEILLTVSVQHKSYFVYTESLEERMTLLAIETVILSTDYRPRPVCSFKKYRLVIMIRILSNAFVFTLWLYTGFKNTHNTYCAFEGGGMFWRTKSSVKPPMAAMVLTIASRTLPPADKFISDHGAGSAAIIRSKGTGVTMRRNLWFFPVNSSPYTTHSHSAPG